MEEPKLQIPIKRYSGETAVVSVRMPKDMLGEIGTAKERTFAEMPGICHRPYRIYRKIIIF